MEKSNAIIAAILGLCLACVIIVGLAVNHVSAITQANAARIEAARAAQAQAAAAIAQAAPELERAAGERAVLEAAARSVDSDRELVDYALHRRDTLLALLLTGAALLATRYGKRAQPTAASTTPKTVIGEGEL